MLKLPPDIARWLYRDETTGTPPETPMLFGQWSLLPPEVQTIVVGHLDFTTRMSLAYCSKSDYEVVKQAPIKVVSVLMDDSRPLDRYFSPRKRANSETRVCVTIKFENASGRTQTIKFYFFKRRKDTECVWVDKVESSGNLKKGLKLEKREFYREAVKFAEKWLKNSSVESINIELRKYPHKNVEIGFLPQCKELSICIEEENLYKFWMERVPPELESLKIVAVSGNDPLTTEELDMDHFKKAHSIKLVIGAIFTDAQFLSLTAKKIVFTSWTISNQAINQFIRNWITGKVRDDFEFAVIGTIRQRSKSEIQKDISGVRQWDAEFQEESRGFTEEWMEYYGDMDCVQINKGDRSGTSATLGISRQRVVFAVTGRQHQLDGHTHTVYTFREFEFEDEEVEDEDDEEDF